jgi:hypothetical protein
VIRNLYDLFEHLGIDIVQQGDSFSESVRLDTSSHPLYPYASAIGELLTIWHQDARYLDELGNPKPIKRKGRQPSFQSLVRLSVPSLNEAYLLTELDRLGAVTVGKDNLVNVHMRSFPAYEDKGLAIQHTLTTLDGFIRTLRHNLDSLPSNSDQLFHRIARRGDFDADEIPALKVRVKRHGQNFLESFDNWLSQNSISRSKKNDRRKRKANVSIGIYLSIDET